MRETNPLKARFKTFALAIVEFAATLPDEKKYNIVADQMMRSGTSSASNYRAACRGKSSRDFRAKLGIVEEELDETMFWLEFLVGLSARWRPLITAHWKEADELLAITVSSIKTSRKNAPPK